MERGIVARARTARYSNTTVGKLAYQLGWFSIALGATELLATRRLTRSLGKCFSFPRGAWERESGLLPSHSPMTLTSTRLGRSPSNSP